jgi:hypothetical protein
VKSSPTDVICVQFGWTEEAELIRNNIIEQIQNSPSCLPSIMFQKNDKWEELRIIDLPQPWSWDLIESEINKRL